MAQRRPTGGSLIPETFGNPGLDIGTVLGRVVRLRNRWKRTPLPTGAEGGRLLGGRVLTRRGTRPVTGFEASAPE